MDSDNQQINEGVLIKSQAVYALLDFSASVLWFLTTGPQGTWTWGEHLLNISQMNGNQNQMTQQPGLTIGSEFEGCDAHSLISLANAFLSPFSVSMTKGLGAKSGHEPPSLMTAESVGNLSCAVTRNDCNASADAGTSCHSLISP